MNQGIVPDGKWRVWKLKAGLRARIEAKYAAQLSLASAAEAVLIRSKLEAEFQKEWEKASPSPYALFAHCGLFKPKSRPLGSGN